MLTASKVTVILVPVWVVLKVQNGGDTQPKRANTKMSNEETQRDHFIIGAVAAGLLTYIFSGNNLPLTALLAVVGGLIAAKFWR